MQLDTEDQRKLLLDIIESINIPGKMLAPVYALKQAVKDAGVEK
jgi:hypothetical protein